MRVLVTGAAGFIGFHLCQRLLAEDHDVIGIDSFWSGQRRNAEDLARQPRFRFIEHDIVDPLPNTSDRVDWVLNLACPASPADFRDRAVDILHVCSRGVFNTLETARSHNAVFLQTSTSEVYGDPLEHPQKETYRGNVNPFGPRACYDEGKRFGEAMIFAYSKHYNLRCRIARIFNTYGPRMRAEDGRVLPNFINQALRGEPLTVYGEGKQTRSFCYVTDMVDGLIRLTASDVADPVNLGNPVEVTIREIADEVIKLTSSSSTITHKPLPTDDPQIRCPDISRATRKLGWQPTVDRETGFRKTIEWFAAQR